MILLNPYRFSSGGDPNFASVHSLLHFEGSNGSTAITDQIAGRVWTGVFSWNGSISTSQFKFGTSSLRLAGSGGIRVDDVSDLFTNTKEWTSEGWVRFDNVTTQQSFWSISPNTSPYNNFLRINATGNWQFVSSSAGTRFTSASAASANTWYHFALERVGNDVTLYIDGTSVGSYTLASFSAGGVVNYGCNTSGGDDMTGYIDECRTTLVARYGGNFTPPTAAFPDS